MGLVGAWYKDPVSPPSPDGHGWRVWALSAVLLLGTMVAAAPAALAAPSDPPTPNGPATVTVHGRGERPPAPPVAALAAGAWEGFGINWNGIPYNNSNGTPGRRLNRLGNPALWRVLPWSRDARQLRVDEQRLLALRPAWVRMSWSINWFDRSYRPGLYQWDSTAMKDRYEDLAFLQAHDISVVAGLWAPPGGTIPYGSPAWVQVQSDLVAHLVNTLHYTDLKYWINVNEPNGSTCSQTDCTISFRDWASATSDLYTSFRQFGLLSHVQLIGPTVSPAYPWTSWPSPRHSAPDWPASLAGDPLLGHLGAVDWHEYVLDGEPSDPPTGPAALRAVQELQIQKATAGVVRTIHGGPSGARTRTILSEYGFQNVSSSTNQGTPTYSFALAMLNFGMDVANGGVNAAAVWELDPDIVHFGIAGDGLWRSSPPYHPYFVYDSTALLFRALPPGSTVESVSVRGGEGLNVLAAKTPSLTGPAWSVLVVNNGANTRWVELRGLTGTGDLAQYDFAKDHRRLLAAGSGSPDDLVPRRGGRGTAEVAPHSAVLLRG